MIGRMPWILDIQEIDTCTADLPGFIVRLQMFQKKDPASTSLFYCVQYFMELETESY